MTEKTCLNFLYQIFSFGESWKYIVILILKFLNFFLKVKLLGMNL